MLRALAFFGVFNREVQVSNFSTPTMIYYFLQKKKKTMIYYYYLKKKHTHIFYPPIFRLSQPNKALETYLLQILKASLFF